MAIEERRSFLKGVLGVGAAAALAKTAEANIPKTENLPAVIPKNEMYLIVSADWEYDDEQHTPTDGSHPQMAFTNREDAEKVLAMLTLREFAGMDIDCHWVNLYHDEEELREEVAKVLGLAADEIDLEVWNDGQVSYRVPTLEEATPTQIMKIYDLIPVQLYDLVTVPLTTFPDEMLRAVQMDKADKARQAIYEERRQAYEGRQEEIEEDDGDAEG